MNGTVQTQFDNLWSANRELQNKTFSHILELTDQPVDWSYDVWDRVVEQLRHPDNHNRAIAAQVLCNLAKSDPDLRIRKDFEALLNVTRDERFVTARHCLQALWKVGAAGEEQQELLIKGLETRYHECRTEKNCTLIRFDIIQSLRNVYAARPDDKIKAKALELIEIEDDLKYRRKYASLWKAKSGIIKK